MSDSIPPSHPPAKPEIESAVVVVIREMMADPNVTPESYESLKDLLRQVTNDPQKLPAEC